MRMISATALLVLLCACSSKTGNTVQPTTAGSSGPAGTTASAAGTTSPPAAAGTSGIATAGTSASAGTSSSSPTAGTSATAGAPAAAGSNASAGASGAPAAGSGGSSSPQGGSTGAAGSAGSSAAAGGGGTDALPPLPLDKALPIVFVHGFAGSASQYYSQAMRFVANGYPIERILAFDHDGQGFDTNAFISGLNQVVDGALAQFKVSKVYLVGHSRGTSVSSMYLSQYASKVAKYVAVDGAACPSSVPCISPNQAMLTGQKHVETCTSKESFAMQYEFFMGEKPKVVDIVRQASPVEISGRLVNFPQNTGRAGATLKFFEVDAATGNRSKPDAIAMFSIAADGNWGPATVNPDLHYEIEVTSGDSDLTSHYYFQPFLRSARLLRLLSGPPNSPSRMNTNVSDKHAALSVMRMREWLASDVLEVSTMTPDGSQPKVNAMTMAAGAANSIGFFMHDAAASPGNSTLAALPWFSMQAFQYGVDVYMPAASPPNGTITVRNLPRGDANKPQVLNVPNWASSKHPVVLMFDDFPH